MGAMGDMGGFGAIIGGMSFASLMGGMGAPPGGMGGMSSGVPHTPSHEDAVEDLANTFRASHDDAARDNEEEKEESSSEESDESEEDENEDEDEA